ncbi:MAG: four helix bundle protein [Bacteroidales bacterium]|nr:four helix bundle protein [Bacteroidales bacterium]
MRGPVYEKSFDLAAEVMNLNKKLTSSGEYVISRQLLRSGTAVGANVNEASSAESLKDFISKNSIALKEAKESFYWLNLLKRSQAVEYDYDLLIDLNIQIIKLLSKIILTSKRKL